MSVAFLITAGSLAIVLTPHTAKLAAGDSRSTQVRAVVATRGAAAAWVAQQVSHDAIISCDRVMCTALAGQGFPSANLRVLGPAAPYPLKSDVVIMTAAIRSQFGSSLGHDWAPAVLASFGSGTARVDVRVIAPHGAAAYNSAMSADLLLRKAAAAGLLGSRQITVSVTARRQLAAGQVDSRLLVVITGLAAQQPVDIVGFGNIGPGASAGIPLRFAELAETVPAAHLASSKYVQSVLALLRAQPPAYRPAHTETVVLARGLTVLRIEFAAPTPLGLFSPQSS